MKRRKALVWMATAMGTSLVATDLLLLSCTPAKEQIPSLFEPYRSLLNRIGHAILPPAKQHPGFLAIGDTDVLINILSNCLNSEVQKQILQGLYGLQVKTNSPSGNQLDSMNDEDFLNVLAPIDQKCFGDLSEEEKEEAQYFRFLKEAILLVYFTNEKVMTETFTYVKVPGKYKGDMEVIEGEYEMRFGFG